MRFSLLCSGEWALSFDICAFIYIGVSLNRAEHINHIHVNKSRTYLENFSQDAMARLINL